MMKRTTVKVIELLLAAVVLLTATAGCIRLDGPSQGTNSGSEVKSPQGTASSGEEKPSQGTSSGETDLWATHMNYRKTESVSRTMDISSFDERLLKYLSEHSEGNYMASPLSFRYALGLLLAGANGETRTELLNALGVSSEEEWIRYCLDFNGFVEYFAEDLEREISEFKDFVKQGWVDKDTPEPFRALRVANSVWKAERVKESFTDAYKESVEKNYAAEYRSFNTANAVEKINEWADIKTAHMIPKLLPDNYKTDSLAIVLMNAL